VRSAGAGGSREIAIIARGAAPGEPRWLQTAALGFLRAGGSNSEEPWLRDAARTAEQEAADATAPLARRRDALELLSYLTPPSPVIQRVLDSPAEPGLHASAARAAIRAEGAAGLARILERWPSAGPELRRAIVDSALTQPGLATSLIEALAAGKIHAPELEAPERERLLRHGDANLRARAAELLGGPAIVRRPCWNGKMRSRCRETSCGGRRSLYACAPVAIASPASASTPAPTISDARERTPDALLRDILDPNRAVDGRYLGYSVTTRDGRVVTGVLDGETSASITLRRADGEAETLARSAVEDVVSTGLSFMPEGLEKDLSSQDLADVIHFLKEWRFVPSEVTSPAADTRGDPPGKPAK
jgi:putative heme-binding domain-containing protein